MFTALSQTMALAVEVSTVSSTVSFPDGCATCSVEVACPAGQEAVAAAFSGEVGPLFEISTYGTLATGGGEPRPWHDALPVTATVSAVCADEGHCFTVARAASPVDPTASKASTAWCPPGSYAVSGGFDVTGYPSEFRVLSSAQVGVFGPTGWRVEADVSGGAAWGLTVEATCVPFSALSSVHLAPGDTTVVSDVVTGASRDGSVTTSVERCDPAGSLALGASVHADGYEPLGLGGVVASTTSCAAGGGRLVNTDPTFAVAASDAPAVSLFYVPAADRAAFEEALSCAVDVPPHGPWWIGIQADILFGVISDGGGGIWLPGSGPVPVDPWGPLYPADPVLPVAIGAYGGDGLHGDPHVPVSLLGRALDGAAVPWVVVGDVAETLDYDDKTVVFVIPEIVPCFRGASPEVAAVNWLVEHRAAIEALAHPTVLWLERDGEGLAALRATWNAAPATPPTTTPSTTETEETAPPPVEERRGCDTSGSAGGWLAALAVLFARRAPRHGRTQAIGAA